jgi:hypothetical protein
MEARMKPKPDEKANEPKAKGKLERELEEGLEETFPASDTPTAIQPGHHEQPR